MTHFEKIENAIKLSETKKDLDFVNHVLNQFVEWEKITITDGLRLGHDIDEKRKQLDK